MMFIARIRQNSLAWQNWHSSHKPIGTLAGVVFRWEPGNVYRSDALSPEQVALLRDNLNVIIEMVSHDMHAPDMVQDSIPDDPVYEPEPEPVQQRWKPPPPKNGTPVTLTPRNPNRK